MRKDQDTLDVVDLGVASQITQGLGLVGPETIGHPEPSGISDVD